jgi:1,4-dihydroxy-2-naphthoate octaprenyltransferase
LSAPHTARSAQTPPAANGPTRPAVWLLATRPRTLTAAAVPVGVGSACAFAAGAFRIGPALAALFGALCIQIGTNLANDVFDAERGADTAERLGPTRVTSSGLLPAAAVRRGMVVAFALAALAGLYLTWVAGPVVLVIGVFSVLSGIAYTGGPYPLGYHGLGDLFVLVFFGFVAVCGTAFVEAGRVPNSAWWSSIAVGALATAILVVNNLRDRETDEKAGKRTLAVRLGERGTVAEYIALIAVAYVVPIFLWSLGRASPLVLLTLTSLPLAWTLCLSVARVRGRGLNAVLAGTAKLLLVYGLLLAIGLSFRLSR